MTDVDDGACTATDLVLAEWACEGAITVANTANSRILEIVTGLEAVHGHGALFRYTRQGHRLRDPLRSHQSIVPRCDVAFTGDYLHRTIRKYYGKQ